MRRHAKRLAVNVVAHVAGLVGRSTKEYAATALSGYLRDGMVALDVCANTPRTVDGDAGATASPVEPRAAALPISPGLAVRHAPRLHLGVTPGVPPEATTVLHVGTEQRGADVASTLAPPTLHRTVLARLVRATRGHMHGVLIELLLRITLDQVGGVVGVHTQNSDAFRPAPGEVHADGLRSFGFRAKEV